MKRHVLMTGLIVLFVTIGTPGLAIAGPRTSATATDVWCTQSGSEDLQAAIDAAHTGDVLRIHGTCVGDFTVPGRGSATALSLRGAPFARLDGAGAGTTLAVAGGVTVAASRLRISGGGNVFEGGGIVVSSATIHLSDSLLTGNAACVGAGIAVIQSIATIVRSTVRDNRAGPGSFGCDFTAGGGIEVDQGSTVTIGRSRIVDNLVTSGGMGGGMDVFGASASLLRSTVQGNVADWNGGGINDQYGSMVGVSHSSILENSTVRNGGGGLAIDGAAATVSASTFERNIAANAGGAILEFADVPDEPVTGNSALLLTDARIVDNTASGEGGGAILNYATNYGGGDFGADGTIATVALRNSSIIGNRATAGYGGGVWNVDDPAGTATASFTNSDLARNRARFGGGISNVPGFAPGDPRGGLVRVSLEGRTAVVDNVASTDGGGVFNDTGAQIEIAPHVVLAGNEPNDCSGCDPRSAPATPPRPVMTHETGAPRAGR